MREILFRGKRVDNGEWVEGYYAKWQGDHVIFPVDPMGRLRKVHPETVGQFTGVFDKNGNRIFEGDVLKLTYDGYSFNCEVKFNDGGFLVYHDNGFNGGDADLTTVGWLKHDDYEYEIIGNIHDNPELL